MGLHGNWVRFKGITKERGFNRHHVTINHNGQIHIGRPAIEPADKRVPGTVPLIAKEFGAHYIPAAQFIRQNRIAIAGTEAFIKPEINHNDILILGLNETIRVTRGRKLSPEKWG